MRPGSYDRLLMQQALADTRLGGRLIHAVRPVLAQRQDYDADTQSAGDVALDDGLPHEAENFRVHALYANVRNVDQSLKTFGAAPPGAEVGDTFITIGLRDHDLMEQVQHDQYAYLVIDGDRFRPTSLTAAGVGRIEEWLVTLQRFSPIYVAPGL